MNNNSIKMNLLCVLNFIFIINESYAALSRDNVGEARIIGGHDAKPHSHPYIVSLQLRFLWARVHFCGGSILSEQWVLTAAHCISESWLIRWLNIDAVAGANDVENYGPTAQVATISQRIAHPSYTGGISAFDIAVLSTKTKFTFSEYVQPINLPTSNFKMENQVLMLAGWGALRTTILIPDMPSRLQELQVKYIPYKECYAAIEDVKEDDEVNPLDENSHICTGPLGGGMAACSGDSGGPLVQVVPKYKLIPYDDIEEECERAVADNDVDNNDDHDLDNDVDNNDNNDLDYDVDNNNNTIVEVNEQVPVVLGIVSWGFSPCGYRGSPTVYTQVSKCVDFIQLYVK